VNKGWGDEFESSWVIRMSDGSTSMRLSRGTYLVYLEGTMSSMSRVLLVFRFWRIPQSDELCEVVLWNEHQGVLVFVLGFQLEGIWIVLLFHYEHLIEDGGKILDRI
jgi:hypothetical protein